LTKTLQGKTSCRALIDLGLLDVEQKTLDAGRHQYYYCGRQLGHICH